MGRWALVAVGVALASSAAAQDIAITVGARAVIEATRETRADYSVFTWNWITPNATDPVEEWAAEFNHGALHRVETPRDRLVADCEAMTGSHMSLETGKIREGREVAQAACGVDSNVSIVAASATGPFESEWGPVRQLLINDSRFERTYVVADNGAIVAQAIVDETNTPRLVMRATAMTRTSPSDIYSVASLSRSAVPVEYRSAPHWSE